MQHLQGPWNWSGWTKSTIVSTTVYFWTRNRGTDKPKPHRFQVKVQDVVHVAGQGCEQGVVGPVRTHLGDDDGPQGERQHHGQHGHGPTVTCTLKVQFRLMRKYLENTRDRKVKKLLRNYSFIFRHNKKKDYSTDLNRFTFSILLTYIDREAFFSS